MNKTNLILNGLSGVRLHVYRKGSGIVPGTANVYGSKAKFVNMQQNSGIHIWYDIKRSERRSQDHGTQRCDASSVEPSVSRCVGRFIENEMNKCSMKLLMSDPNLEQCDEQMFSNQHFDIITGLDTMDEREIFEMTGCMPGCEKSEFDLMTIVETPKADRILSFYLTYLHGEYDRIEEYYIYDHISFIADIGGYLGLLLGYSLLSMYQTLINCVLSYKFDRGLPRSITK